ncbi:hypothetical protein PV379_04045 [Streptomyces caniscabiei]|uniref:hypothetical protein n=1 Tax=Streptomyces caniscabiei TaxID=2746961 RepID=UPI0029A6CCD5|nr:hypothetical protein [Streptomyces caniscabiei]MDX2776508.1 hypothetical protein [Streptomyces caniscabiei]
MADQKPPRRRTGAYQHGVYLGPGEPDSSPQEETPTEDQPIGRETGAYQDGERIGGPEPSSDTAQVDTPATPPTEKPRGRHRRT